MTYSPGHHIGTGGWSKRPISVCPLTTSYQSRTTRTTFLPEDLANVVLRPSADGEEALLLKDVADVVVDHQPMIGDGIIDGDIGLLLIVEKFPWGNTLQVTHGVEEAIDSLRPGLKDISIDTRIFRPATFIETSIDNLSHALIIACILVVIVLCVFLYDWRVALISCTAIPLSLMAALMVLYFRGTTINTMILAGFVIALGAVVDDAIVDIENIVRRLRQARHDGSSKSVYRLIIGSLAGSAACNYFLNVNRGHGARASLFHGRTFGSVLQATGDELRLGYWGFDDSGLDGYSCVGVYPVKGRDTRTS